MFKEICSLGTGLYSGTTALVLADPLLFCCLGVGLRTAQSQLLSLQGCVQLTDDKCYVIVLCCQQVLELFAYPVQV